LQLKQYTADLFCLFIQHLWLKAVRPVFVAVYRGRGVTNPRLRAKEIIASKRELQYFQSVDFRDKRVVDVGCGDGGKTFNYQDLSNNVVGLDINRKAIRKAHAKNSFGNVAFLVASATALPFRSSSFDVSVCHDALEHVNDVSTAISEMKSVVNQHGFLCLNFSVWGAPFAPHLGFFEFFLCPWLHLLFSKQTISNMLVKLGKIPENFNPFGGVNDLTVRQFEYIAETLGLHSCLLKLKTYPPFGALLNTLLREYVTSQVVSILRKK
jgi:ubiquinone/menaquinone biosynthesis C-methylase UbiE